MSSGYTTGWQEDLIDYLISSGTTGRNMSEILRRFQNRVASDQITSELESYGTRACRECRRRWDTARGPRGSEFWREG